MTLRIIAGASVLALVPATALATSRPPAAHAPFSQSACRVDIGSIAVPSLDRAAHLPLRVEIFCPANAAYRVALLPDTTCAQPRALDVEGTAVFFDVRLPDGSIWCDGTGGTSELRSVGTGNVQQFTAVVDVVPPSGIPRAGHSTTVLRVQLQPQ